MQMECPHTPCMRPPVRAGCNAAVQPDACHARCTAAAVRLHAAHARHRPGPHAVQVKAAPCTNVSAACMGAFCACVRVKVAGPSETDRS